MKFYGYKDRINGNLHTREYRQEAYDQRKAEGWDLTEPFEAEDSQLAKAIVWAHFTGGTKEQYFAEVQEEERLRKIAQDRGIIGRVVTLKGYTLQKEPANYMVAGILKKEGAEDIWLLRSTDFPGDLFPTGVRSVQNIEFEEKVTWHEDAQGIYMKPPKGEWEVEAQLALANIMMEHEELRNRLLEEQGISKEEADRHSHEVSEEYARSWAEVQAKEEERTTAESEAVKQLLSLAKKYQVALFYAINQFTVETDWDLSTGKGGLGETDWDAVNKYVEEQLSYQYHFARLAYDYVQAFREGTWGK